MGIQRAPDPAEILAMISAIVSRFIPGEISAEAALLEIVPLLERAGASPIASVGYVDDDGGQSIVIPGRPLVAAIDPPANSA